MKAVNQSFPEFLILVYTVWRMQKLIMNIIIAIKITYDRFPCISIYSKPAEKGNKLIEQQGIFHVPDSFQEVIENSEGMIDRGVKMGEGWLLTSEMVTLIKNGVNNIVCCQPFGCLPNHIVAKGMARKLKNKYPYSNIVAVDYDPSATKVNQENRLKLMLSNARLNETFLKEKQEETNKAIAKQTAYACD